jgi:hypothetical protein
MEEDSATDTSFGSEPHGAITRRKPTMSELIEELARYRYNVAKIAHNWAVILRQTFEEPGYTVRLEPAETADILSDTEAILVKVVCNKGPVPTPIFYLLAARAPFGEPWFFAQQPEVEVERGLHAQNPMLRSLRILIKRDQDDRRENQFVWSATAAADRIRIWRYNVYGKDDQLDPFGEPMLSARFMIPQSWQGAGRKAEVTEGEWVWQQRRGSEVKLVFDQWASYDATVPGADYLRYMGCELTDDMHPVEKLYRPHLTVGRYRVFRPAFAHVAKMGCDPEQDEKFLKYWLFHVKRQAKRLASGLHVTNREADSHLDTFFLIDVVDEDLRGTAHDML